MAFKTNITCDHAGCTAQFEFLHEQCNVITEDAWKAAESAGWSGIERDFCPLHPQPTRVYLNDGEAVLAVGEVEFILDSTQQSQDPVGFRVGNWGTTHFEVAVGEERKLVHWDGDRLYYEA